MSKRKMKEIAAHLVGWLITSAEDSVIEDQDPEVFVEGVPTELISAALLAGGHPNTWVAVADLRAHMVECVRLSYRSIIRTLDPLGACLAIFGPSAAPMVARMVESGQSQPLIEVVRAVSIIVATGTHVTLGSATAAREGLADPAVRDVLKRLTASPPSAMLH